MKRAVTISLIAVVALVAAACGSGSGAAGSPATTAGGPLTIRDAWARAGVAGGNTAVYMNIVNGRVAADTLLSVATDAAQQVGIHETSTDASGMTGMHMVPSLPIAGGATVALAPGGYHIMLEGLKADLKAGDSITVTLTFQNAGVVTVTAEVRAS